MLGAIAGDVIGSPYEGAEGNPIKTPDFPLFSPASRFTDDSVLTVATADAILSDTPYDVAYRRWYRRYPNAGYGGFFHQWGQSDEMGAYNSFGNGSAMRISPIGWACDDLEKVLEEAGRSAAVTHNHPEGVKGAQVTAGALFLARSQPFDEVMAWAEGFGYRLDASIESLRPHFTFDVTCQGTVPVALRCAFEADDFVDAIRLAVSLGGDADTLAAIAGSIAEARFGVPDEIGLEVTARLDERMNSVFEEFTASFLPSA